MVDRRVTLIGTTTLAGSVISLGDAVRGLAGSGVRFPDADRRRHPQPLGDARGRDRGRLAVGQRADLVELGPGLGVQRVMRAGIWLDA